MAHSSLKAWLLGLSLLALLFTSAFSPAASVSPIEVTENSASLSFPAQITFYLAAQNAAAIDSVTLTYGTNGKSCLSESARQEIKFDRTSRPRLSWAWDLQRSGGLPPGAQVWWQWEIRAGSETRTTERKTLVIEDEDYTWQHLTQGKLSVYWAEGGNAFGAMLMQQAAYSLDRLGREAGVRPSGSIRLTVYPSVYELRWAVLHAPDWAGGVAFPEYGSIMTAVGPGEMEWAAQVIPHELAHLVTEERIFNCTGARLPTWLSEGLAVFSEGEMNSRDDKLLEDALAGDRLPRLHTLADGFSAEGDRASLSYLQSGAVVRYLIDNYGPDPVTDLLAAIQEGSRIDEALKTTYEMDTDEIDAAWRTSRGYATAPPDAKPTAPADSPARTAIPTLPLWFPQASATPTPAPTSTPTATPTLEPAAPPTAAPTPTPTPAPESGARLPLLVPAGAGGFLVVCALAWFTLRKQNRKP